MQQLSGLDASFLYFETQNAPTHIGSYAIYDQSTAAGGRVSFKGILANVESRLHLARCFRQKLVRSPFDLDHPYWIEDSDFDLEFHIRHIALPQPGDWRQLCIQVARIHARPLDLTEPLWEMYVIEGLDNVDGAPPGSFAVLTKIHHAAIDGVSGAELAAAIHDLEPDATAAQPRRCANTCSWCRSSLSAFPACFTRSRSCCCWARPGRSTRSSISSSPPDSTVSMSIPCGA